MYCDNVSMHGVDFRCPYNKTHINTNTVFHVKFTSNLSPKSMGSRIRIELCGDF